MPYSIDQLADETRLHPKKVRRRIVPLTDRIPELSRKGKNGMLLLDDVALSLLKTIIDYENGGLTIDEAVKATVNQRNAGQSSVPDNKNADSVSETERSPIGQHDELADAVASLTKSIESMVSHQREMDIKLTSALKRLPVPLERRPWWKRVFGWMFREQSRAKASVDR